MSCPWYFSVWITVERKVDLLVTELKNYNISIVGIQETKWFGSDIWPIGEWTCSHSGHDLPVDSDAAVRQNGVGILLDSRATAAWRVTGEVWRAVSKRYSKDWMLSVSPRWYDLCQTISPGGVTRGPPVVAGSFVCVCGRTFGHSGDLT